MKDRENQTQIIIEEQLRMSNLEKKIRDKENQKRKERDYFQMIFRDKLIVNRVRKFKIEIWMRRIKEDFWIKLLMIDKKSKKICSKRNNRIRNTWMIWQDNRIQID